MFARLLDIPDKLDRVINAIANDLDTKNQDVLKTQNHLKLALESIVSYPHPVIAMLNGNAFGAGCELAIACDSRIGADNIRMGMPPVKLGVVYFPEGLQRFIPIIGLFRS